MEVMSAGVGFGAGGAGKLQTGFLSHGQSVHIGSQQQALAALADGGADTVAAGLGFNAQLFQFCQNIGLPLGHIQTHFCVDMEESAVGDGFVFQCKGSFIIVHMRHPFFHR